MKIFRFLFLCIFLFFLAGCCCPPIDESRDPFRDPNNFLLMMAAQVTLCVILLALSIFIVYVAIKDCSLRGIAALAEEVKDHWGVIVIYIILFLTAILYTAFTVKMIIRGSAMMGGG